jgi:PhzF family phenazine biosynthesis protein
MNSFKIYQVDAFAERVFSGNPAAVVPLTEWLPDPVMQAIALENNLSETAFFVPEGDGWLLRWFTPLSEIDLCGHATLASGYVAARFLRPEADRFVFRTLQAGHLTVTRDGDGFALDLPARPPRPQAGDGVDALLEALGGGPAQQVLGARDWLVIYDRPQTVAGLTPDFSRLAALGRKVIVTAAGALPERPGGADADFVSRFFAPHEGVNEDPVTGSAHCTLVPFWAARLGRDRLQAFQASPRGGRLSCSLQGDRVVLGGKAVLYLEGVIHV